MINLNNIVSVEKIYGRLFNTNICNSYKVIFNVDKVCFVPLDEANSDYQAIQQWIAEGNTVIDNPPE